MFEAVVGEICVVRDDMFGDSLEWTRHCLVGKPTEELVETLRRGVQDMDERSFFKRVMNSEECLVAWKELRSRCGSELDALKLVGIVDRAADQNFLSTEEQIIGHDVKGVGDVHFLSAVLGGGWIDPRDQTRAHIYSHIAPSGEVAVQLQVKCVDYLKCVHLTLGQFGRDLIARADWAAYTTVDHELGYDFELARDKHLVPVATSAGADGYGVVGLYLYYLNCGWC